MDSAVAGVGFFVLSASSGSSHVFFEKSSCGAPPPDLIERLSFWFRLVVVELFAFCADDVTARSNEVTKSIATPSNSENANKGKIDFRIDSILLRLVLRSLSPHRLFRSGFGDGGIRYLYFCGR